MCGHWLMLLGSCHLTSCLTVSKITLIWQENMRVCMWLSDIEIPKSRGILNVCLLGKPVFAVEIVVLCLSI